MYSDDMTNATETLTDDMIHALRTEAERAGDERAVAYCDNALEHGTRDRLELVADMLNEARAQDDSRPFVRVVP